MFLEHFKITGQATGQIFILGALGYFLVKKNMLSASGLEALSRLVIQVIFPAMIFTQLLKNFSFSLYPDWWIFPLTSFVITLSGSIVGFILLKLTKLKNNKLQFLSLVGFQNSGYLPSYGLVSVKKHLWNEELLFEARGDGFDVISPTGGRGSFGHLEGWGRGRFGGGAVLYFLCLGGNA